MISFSGFLFFSGLFNIFSFGDFDSDFYYILDLDSGYGSLLFGYDFGYDFFLLYSEYNLYVIDIFIYNSCVLSLFGIMFLFVV